MQYTRTFCTLLIASTLIPALAQTNKIKQSYGVYLAGVSASFTDSLVYFTDIQYMDSASISKDLLNGRSQYSLQLKDYLEQQKQDKNRTCFILFSKKKNKLQKEINKIKQKYQKGGTLIFKETGTDFQFTKAEIYE